MNLDTNVNFYFGGINRRGMKGLRCLLKHGTEESTKEQLGLGSARWTGEE